MISVFNAIDGAFTVCRVCLLDYRLLPYKVWCTVFIIIPGASVAVSNHDDENHSEKGEERTQKLLESIAQVSDMASQQSGFVYDSTSGLYYDVQTGMYYDQVCVCVFVCVYCAYICVYVYVCVHVCVCACVVRTYVYNMFTCVYMYVCVAVSKIKGVMDNFLEQETLIVFTNLTA